jgi:hypothetical protein
VRQPVTACEQAFINRLLEVCPDAKVCSKSGNREIAPHTLLSLFWEMADDWAVAARWGQEHPKEKVLIRRNQHKTPVAWNDDSPMPEPGVWVGDV